MPRALFFLLKIALAIQGLLWFHADFRTVCSISVKKYRWNFGRSFIESVDCFG